MKLGFIYRDQLIRRTALAADVGDPVTYCLYGANNLKAQGHEIKIFMSQKTEGLFNYILYLIFKNHADYLGYFKFILCQKDLDVLVVTAHTYLKISLVLKKLGIINSKICWITIGFQDKFCSLKSGSRWFWRWLLKSINRAICFGWKEQDELKNWVPSNKVKFFPFGAPLASLNARKATSDEHQKLTKIVSVGGDPKRDYETVLKVAASLPEIDFSIVASDIHKPVLRNAPSNVCVQYKLPFDQMLNELLSAKVVLLCSKENNYSGATTVLLQAMALGKPVIVTRTQAIIKGYGFENAKHLIFIKPGSVEQGICSIKKLLSSETEALEMGKRGKQLIEKSLNWECYIKNLEKEFYSLRKN
ncbi:MAG: glycosyltransferase [Bacteroidota bacterium]